MSDYPPVHVAGSPGHEDFDGWLISGPPEWPWWIVGFEADGQHDVTIVSSAYVTLKEA